MLSDRCVQFIKDLNLKLIESVTPSRERKRLELEITSLIRTISNFTKEEQQEIWLGGILGWERKDHWEWDHWKKNTDPMLNILLLAATTMPAVIPSMIVEINKLPVEAQNEIWKTVISAYDGSDYSLSRYIGSQAEISPELKIEVEALKRNSELTFMDRFHALDLCFIVRGFDLTIFSHLPSLQSQHDESTTLNRYRRSKLCEFTYATLDRLYAIDEVICSKLGMSGYDTDWNEVAVLDVLSDIKKTGGDYTAKLCEAVLNQQSPLHKALNIDYQKPQETSLLKAVEKVVEKIKNPLSEKQGCVYPSWEEIRKTKEQLAVLERQLKEGDSAKLKFKIEETKQKLSFMMNRRKIGEALDNPNLTFLQRRGVIHDLYHRTHDTGSIDLISQYRSTYLLKAIESLDVGNQIEAAIRSRLLLMRIESQAKKIAILDALNEVKQIGGDYITELCNAVKNEGSSLYKALNIHRFKLFSGNKKPKILQDVERVVSEILAEKALAVNHGIEQVSTPAVVDSKQSTAVSAVVGATQKNAVPPIEEASQVPKIIVGNSEMKFAQIRGVYPSLVEYGTEYGIELTSFDPAAIVVPSVAEDAPVEEEPPHAIQHGVEGVTSDLAPQASIDAYQATHNLIDDIPITKVSFGLAGHLDHALIDFSDESILVDLSDSAPVIAAGVPEKSEEITSGYQLHPDLASLAASSFGLFSTSRIEPGEPLKQAASPLSQAGKFAGTSKFVQSGAVPEKKAVGSKDTKQKTATTTANRVLMPA